MPFIKGSMIATGGLYQSDQHQPAARVIVFLSSHCADCHKKIPELIKILPAMMLSEIEFLIVVMEQEKQARKFLEGTPLFTHVIKLDRVSIKSLNPSNAAPFYIFINDQLLIEASYFIGDENWNSFTEQMHEILNANPGPILTEQ